jgi:hypothetical protein
MKAIEISRRLNRDASMVSWLCAEYKAVRNRKTEEKMGEWIKSNSQLWPAPANPVT